MNENKTKNHYKILFVEQDVFITDMYKVIFEERGFDFFSLEKIPDDFIEKVFEIKPDIITMDLIVSHEGFQAVRMLKNDQRTKGIPVVFLTNCGQKEDIEQGMALGAIDYMIKGNYSQNEVIDKLLHHLNANPSL